MMRKWCLLVGFILLTAVPSLDATIFGTVKGIVHDPQHLPVKNATVTLKAVDSEWMQAQMSSESGAFEFDTVPIGDYTVAVIAEGFQQQQQNVIVQSGTSPELHVEMGIAAASENVDVIGTPVTASVDSITTTSMLSRTDIQTTPGADRTDSLQMITDYVPGAYMVHDMLHIRGGHQFQWLIDGVPVPNTNIGDNVGPQVDPKDLDYVEVQRGSYEAEYGDRTYGVFNAVPRTGFERNRECELVASFGNYYQTNDQVNCGGHTQRFAYYGSLNGNRTDLGLETPVPQIEHDAGNGYGGFGDIVYNVDPQDQLRLVGSLRRDFFQIPNPPTADISQPFDTAPEIVVVTPSNASQQDSQREADGMVNFSWIHTFSHDGTLNISPFYHFNGSEYDSSPNDFPNAVTVHRSSSYTGGQLTVGSTIARNTWEGGLYGFWQRDNQLFGALFNDGFGPPLQTRQIVNGNLEAIFVQDKIAVTSWLTLDGGVRYSHFESSSVEEENATNPRGGVAVKIPRLNWVFRGFYGQFYQAPPLITIGGELLGFVNTPNSPDNPQQFVPLLGERDTERQFGVTIPLKGWSADIDTFRTDSHNFLDHGNVNYVFNGTVFPTNIYLPLTTQDALIRGWELTLRSPRFWHRLEGHLAYSNQVAEFMGTITGGLTIPGATPQIGWKPLDHDQRNTLSVGLETNLPWRTLLSGDVIYGSGFSNGSFDGMPGSPEYLSPHTTVDLSLSKSVREKWTVSVNATNIGNSHLLIDDSLTFGGFHYDDPREVYGEVRYRFHY